MFYEPAKRNHGLRHDPFKACVVPRPIGWITTVSAAGVVNLAPYSFFNAIASDPPMVCFAPNGLKPDGARKDTLVNVEATGEFVCNLATWELRQPMLESSAPLPHGTSEVGALALLPSSLVKPPRLAASPIHLECKVWQILALPPERSGGPNTLVIGQVVGIHIDDKAIHEGKVDYHITQPIARLGYLDYSDLGQIWPMQRPKGGE